MGMTSTPQALLSSQESPVAEMVGRLEDSLRVGKSPVGTFESLSSCAMQRLLTTLAGPWTLFLTWTLLKDGALRFGELRRRITGISSKVLTERLRLLEREGFVTRRYSPSVPPQVTYEPTDRLRELTVVLHSLNELAQRWYAKPCGDDASGK
jgi:DNA-binding HxlR family transcriptional regulator